MAKKPVNPIIGDSNRVLGDDEIDSALPINQNQLKNTKVYASREDYIDSLPDNLKFMEVGVAWGYYSKLVADKKNPSLIHLVDRFDNEMLCWSGRKFGQCLCEPKHEKTYTPETHEAFILNLFENYNLTTFRGYSKNILPNIKDTYDYIYLDITNDRPTIRTALWDASKLIKPGGIIGINDYTIYDGIIDDSPYGTFQAVNEFLYFNKDWSVDAIALHVLGFYDIYIKKSLNE